MWLMEIPPYLETNIARCAHYYVYIPYNPVFFCIFLYNISHVWTRIYTCTTGWTCMSKAVLTQPRLPVLFLACVVATYHIKKGSMDTYIHSHYRLYSK